MSGVSFHAQKKQKTPCLSAWVSTTVFGETSLWLESPMLTHRNTTTAFRAAATILNSYFTGTAFRPARQRPATAPSSHLETSASNLDIKCSWFSVMLRLLSFWAQSDVPYPVSSSSLFISPSSTHQSLLLSPFSSAAPAPTFKVYSFPAGLFGGLLVQGEQHFCNKASATFH